MTLFEGVRLLSHVTLSYSYVSMKYWYLIVCMERKLHHIYLTFLLNTKKNFNIWGKHGQLLFQNVADHYPMCNPL